MLGNKNPEPWFGVFVVSKQLVTGTTKCAVVLIVDGDRLSGQARLNAVEFFSNP